LKKLTYLLALGLSLTACNQDKESKEITEVVVEETPVIQEEYGFVLNDFEVFGIPYGPETTLEGSWVPME
jgi:hypothetical protein